jgi:hypothetical protein
MPSLEDDQAKLGAKIAQVLDESSPVVDAADKIVTSGEWLHDLQPRCYAVVSVSLSLALVSVLQAKSSQPGPFFDASCTRKIQILLSVRSYDHDCGCASNDQVLHITLHHLHKFRWHIVSVRTLLIFCTRSVLCLSPPIFRKLAHSGPTCRDPMLFCIITGCFQVWGCSQGTGEVS